MKNGNGKVCHYLECNSLFVPIYSLNEKVRSILRIKLEWFILFFISSAEINISKKQHFCYRTFSLCSIYGDENQNLQAKMKRRIAFTIRSFYKIKLINYQYARKPITVLKSRLRSTALFSYLVRVACHSKNGFTFKEPWLNT